jgi:hypothetical protein
MSPKPVAVEFDTLSECSHPISPIIGKGPGPIRPDMFWPLHQLLSVMFSTSSQRLLITHQHWRAGVREKIDTKNEIYQGHIQV